MDQKIIRDPVYDYIAIDRDRDGWILELLDTPEVQRLRYIRQLGVSYLAYPGATHCRFGHTLGVLHLMQQAVERIERMDANLVKDARDPLLAAAVLHDVGHGPFSHLLESKLSKPGTSHEDWTCRIIEAPESGVCRILQDRGILSHVVSLIDGNTTSPPPSWQKALISSQLDVDRMDYLVRDSYYTGVGYGRLDHYRLLHTMSLETSARRQGGQTEDLREFVWPDKAKYAIEEYVFARFYMYLSVYYHHCTRGYEKLLEAIWDRAADLMQTDDICDAGSALKPFLRDGEPDVAAYLRLRDCHFLTQIESWQDANDPVLSDLCQRFLRREGFKVIRAAGTLDGFKGHDRLRDAIAYLRGTGGIASQSPRSYLLEDRGRVTPYKPYRWGEKEEPQPILLASPNGVSEITEAMVRLKSVSAEDNRFVRYYCPQEHAPAIQKILDR